MNELSTIDNSADIIDSRDVIARIGYLESMIEDGDASNALDEDEIEELALLKELADEAAGYAADWTYGEALIRETYFTEYAQQLAEDIGAIDTNAGWPLGHIDWEAAAEALKVDYTAVDFDGVTYYIR